ncbi:MAG: TonB-dependent receptor plug domain-containing protein [Bacteroidota bacterium]
MPLKTILFFFFALCLSSLNAQFSPARWLQDYQAKYLPEKVFVHTDKNIYAGGEDLWAAVYLVDGQSHRPDSISSVIYLELRNQEGTVITQRKLYSADGHTSGDLKLPADLIPGIYQLVAYTNYQRNSGEQSLFRKALRIVGGLPESGGITETNSPPAATEVSLAGKTTLRFFPEGGDCVEGLPCLMAVTATTPTGAPLQTAIAILDGSGKLLKQFATTAEGVGTFSYVPQPGLALKLQVADQAATYSPPPALSEGLHLSVTEVNDTFRLRVTASTPEELAGATVLLHLRGVPLLERTITSAKKQTGFLLPAQDLPPGVIVATVFDHQLEPVAERLFFVPPRATALSVMTNKQSFGQRAPVTVSIEMPDDNLLRGKSAEGRVSMSVVAQAASGGPAADDIRSWLLVNSDLDRPIPNAPSVLFSGSEADQAQKIDNFLLTRGWRRFRWEALARKDHQPSFRLEEGIYLRGRMTQLENRTKARPGKVFLTRLENAFLEETVTDEEGYFAFGPYAVFDTLDIALQGRFKRGKKNRYNPNLTLADNSYVFLQSVELPPPTLPTLPTFSSSPNPEVEDSMADYQELSRKSLTISRTYDSLIIDLDVIDVVTKRKDPTEERRNERALLYGTPDNRIVVDDFPGGYAANSFLDLVRTLPGVQVTGTGIESQILIRGISTLTLSTQPLFLIDGQQTDLETLFNIPIPDIEFIDVLRGATASAYGSQGANGVILVYTRSGGGNNAAKKPGLLNTKLNGYHKVREFALFDPELPENRNRPDIRTTLHWQPNLRTSPAGQATESFISSDQPGKYFIIVQGLRQDGLPFWGTSAFEVE